MTYVFASQSSRPEVKARSQTEDMGNAVSGGKGKETRRRNSGGGHNGFIVWGIFD